MNSSEKVCRRAALAVIASSALATTAFVQAQTFPTKTITIQVGYAPGGPNDLLARTIAQKLQERLGQTVIVENRPGANGVLATNAVKASPPDGHTLLVTATSFGTNPLVLPQVAKYDPIEDFTHIAQVGAILNVMVVNPALPIKTVRELVDYAKAHPGKLNVALSGNGSSDHLASVLFENVTGVKVNMVTYKGSAPATRDVIAGIVDMRMDPMSTALPFLTAGRLRALAVMETKRHPKFPDIPAIEESVSGVSYGGYYGVLGPRGMPPAVVARLNSEINDIMKLPDVVARIEGLGLDIVTGTAPAFKALIDKDRRTWAKVISENNIKVQE